MNSLRQDLRYAVRTLARKRVTSEFFETLGTPAQVGRTFVPEDYRDGRSLILRAPTADSTRKEWDRAIGIVPHDFRHLTGAADRGTLAQLFTGAKIAL